VQGIAAATYLALAIDCALDSQGGTLRVLQLAANHLPARRPAEILSLLARDKRSY